MISINRQVLKDIATMQVIVEDFWEELQHGRQVVEEMERMTQGQVVVTYLRGGGSLTKWLE